MLQDMDNIEASCAFYVEDGTLHRLEQSKINVLTITEMGIELLTVHHLVSVSCQIHGICCDKHQQTYIPSKHVLCISH